MTELPSCDITRCEALARRLLPQMRAEMVYRLVSERGISQSEASKRLGISRAAVSQYMSRKRGFARQDFPGEPIKSSSAGCRRRLRVKGRSPSVTSASSAESVRKQ